MPKERNKADSYREKAYEGDTKAMNNLGVCYERGTGVKVSFELAFEWYMKAAEQGDVYGCFNVGECYYHGKGVEQDVRLAFEWYLFSNLYRNFHASRLGAPNTSGDPGHQLGNSRIS